MTDSSPNIVVFGGPMVGKSSIVNMILGEDIARTSSRAQGCTSECTEYTTKIRGSSYNLYDTPGLGVSKDGTVSETKAIVDIWALLHGLKAGVNLLVYVIRGPRIDESTIKNYKILFEVFCQKKVPIVVVVTGFDDEDDMENWWTKNESKFVDYEMEFSGHACVTATKGKKKLLGMYSLEEEYQKSKMAVKNLITAGCSKTPWKMKELQWHKLVMESIGNRFGKFFDLRVKLVDQRLINALIEVGGMSEQDATEVANGIVQEMKKSKK